MGIYLNPGNTGFARVLNSQIYVDKTGILGYLNSVIDTEQCYVCVSRPRRFGKSITAEMITAYYGAGCDSTGLFRGLKISANPGFTRHLNQYNVIYADMNDFRNKSLMDGQGHTKAMESICLFQKEIIRELRKQFPNQIEEGEYGLPSALTQIYQKSGVQFIIILDEWDAVFREDKMEIEAQEAYINLLRGLFKSANSRKFIKLAYLTGILPIKKYGTQSALNNFDEFTMVMPEPLEEYVGFTEKEVMALYEEYGLEYGKAKYWYDGYVFGDGIHVFNPKSVVDSIRRNRFASYWTRTETYESLKGYINIDFSGLRETVVCMIAGGRCKVNPDKFQNDITTFHDRDDILTLLIHLGYLAYDFEAKEAYIPNEEVKGEFRNAVEGSRWDIVGKLIEESEKLLQATWRLDCEAVAEGLDRVHMENTSILSYHDENSLSCVVSLAYYSAVREYVLFREMPAGKGYADIVFLPKQHSVKPAMVVELKWDASVEGAVSQMKEKQYGNNLKNYTGKILLVGVNYDKKTKNHQCLIEEMEKTGQK
ncbi:AAA family ATPase [bacterium D16-51]|nr:AAA family ATPase [bacterium D16-59]RKI59837.1 AAA family ATPase [bacterium D16-51]